MREHPWVIAPSSRFPAAASPTGSIRRLTPNGTMEGVEIVEEERAPNGEQAAVDTETMILNLSEAVTIRIEGNDVVLDRHDFLYVGRGVGYRWMTSSGVQWRLLWFR